MKKNCTYKILLSKDINEYNNDISDVHWQMNKNVDIKR
jgi:hypothetical protein